MNLVGKILVVLILIMSLVFMSFAVAVYSTHRNWVTAVNDPQTGLKAKLAAEQQKNQQLQAAFASIQAKLSEIEAARRQALAKLETEKDQLQQEKSTLQKQQEDAAKTYAETTAVASNALGLLKDKQTQIDSLRTDIKEAQDQRDEKLKEVVDATDKLNQAMGEEKRLEVTNVRLAEQLAKAKIHLDRAGVQLEAPTDGIPPAVDGIVLATSSNGLVEISLGSDMGLARGNTLEVSRGNKYLGRVEVIQTQPDRAVARVLTQFQKGRIEKEDRVATRLN
ncbi:MAG TPA: hypothetical protein VHZ24_07615 [Pirellulales bacterium]|jgi:flagellar capping protein FliD|nr:hypothetical protein [Pirellulales bacterium]